MDITQEINDIKARFSRIEAFIDEYNRSNGPTTQTFNKNVRFNGGFSLKDGTTLSTGTTTGLKIGSSTSEKVAFFGTTPAVQQASIADPVGGATNDAQARSAINSILDVLDTFGLTA